MYRYDVVVGHHRHGRPRRSFRHRLHTWLVDLDELPRLPGPLRTVASFDSRDHFDDPERGIRENLDSWLWWRGVDLGGGRVWMLAHARTFGYVFNPISLYWCYRHSGELACVVAEVHNTYGGRHRYLLDPDENGNCHTEKAFFVSPFLPNRANYRMTLTPPGRSLSIRVELVRDGSPLLTATMVGRGRPSTPAGMLRTELFRPFTPHRVAALIRLHGIALWSAGAPRGSGCPAVRRKGVR
ncbi:DUF1365 domain-containing protein [Actinopolyspora mortivallis]|uniref:DUF1365 domain-containing protein n=1 Tax=Actinopolyspora mortivallis TaxID=33906 RepID=A0A2T0GWM3_ACTMO|nr:DUF1365 domain-containing protein [Actinopolyspora mortivallis]PRW63515.1 DUF1365 domain-containing protein [Actinopolyspora mortivallis]